MVGDSWSLYAWQRVEEKLRADIRELRVLVERLESLKKDVCKPLHSET